MKELIIKCKDTTTSPYYVKFRCLIPDNDESRYNEALLKYTKYVQNHDNHILLINQLDENGEFITTII